MKPSETRLLKRSCSFCCQVYKALRAGVQDVAVKFLHRANADDLQKFIEVGADANCCVVFVHWRSPSSRCVQLSIS